MMRSRGFKHCFGLGVRSCIVWFGCMVWKMALKWVCWSTVCCASGLASSWRSNGRSKTEDIDERRVSPNVRRIQAVRSVLRGPGWANAVSPYLTRATEFLGGTGNESVPNTA